MKKYKYKNEFLMLLFGGLLLWIILFFTEESMIIKFIAICVILLDIIAIPDTISFRIWIEEDKIVRKSLFINKVMLFDSIKAVNADYNYKGKIRAVYIQPKDSKDIISVGTRIKNSKELVQKILEECSLNPQIDISGDIYKYLR